MSGADNPFQTQIDPDNAQTMIIKPPEKPEELKFDLYISKRQQEFFNHFEGFGARYANDKELSNSYHDRAQEIYKMMSNEDKSTPDAFKRAAHKALKEVYIKQAFHEAKHELNVPFKKYQPDQSLPVDEVRRDKVEKIRNSVNRLDSIFRKMSLAPEYKQEFAENQLRRAPKFMKFIRNFGRKTEFTNDLQIAKTADLLQSQISQDKGLINSLVGRIDEVKRKLGNNATNTAIIQELLKSDSFRDAPTIDRLAFAEMVEKMLNKSQNSTTSVRSEKPQQQVSTAPADRKLGDWARQVLGRSPNSS